MHGNGKRVFKWTVVILIAFYVINNPISAAQNVKDLAGWLEGGAESVVTFGTELGK
jgi:hypothetical protein